MYVLYVAALDVITVRVWVELDTAQGQHKWDSKGVFLNLIVIRVDTNRP
jgi:hypothetical protein